MNLRHKTIVVTGACSGIGAETVRLLRGRGARVIGMDRNDPMLTLDGFVKIDLSEQAAIDNAMKELPVQIDALANVAGVPGTAPAGLVGRVNYLGLRHLSERVAERMAPGGSIVNVSSIIGTHGNVGQAVYAGSKAAVIGITKSLAKELADRTIRVNAIAPGFIDTAMTRQLSETKYAERVASIRMGRIGTPQDVARVALFFASDLSAYVTGQVVGVDGGMLI